jgi:CRISPR/Cas system Type II protein with McrA/HNH and RuvC-like nuclease domain
LYLFKTKKIKLRTATRDFQRREHGHVINKSNKYEFYLNDVLNKFGIETMCYLSGIKINLLTDTNYSLDHITAASRGGDNSLENMGILNGTVNKMKHNLTIDEFLNLCKRILEHNGYRVRKKKQVRKVALMGAHCLENSRMV